jgi:hypothetical protein
MFAFPPIIPHPFQFFDEEQALSLEAGPLGFIQPRYDDASVKAATSMIDSHTIRRWTGQQVSPNEMLDVIRSAADHGQITRQEWDQISDWANRSRLSPAALQVFRDAATTIASYTSGGSEPAAPTITGADLNALIAHLELEVQIANVASAVGAIGSFGLGGTHPSIGSFIEG